jgi:serine protease Do
MRLLRMIPVLLVAGMLCGGAAGTTGAVADLPDIVAPLLGAVVNISVLKQAEGTAAQGADPMARPTSAQGSGFIIDPAGYIVTNRHVVAGAYSVSAVLADGSTFPARVLSTNARPDLALLKIDAAKPLPTVHFGDSDALRIGQPVVAIGNPLGLSSSVTFGIISALNRDIDTTMIDDFIQTDAAINHGNSGGPLFNLKGEVVGVNWALLAPGAQTGSAGLGLAIPANDAAFVVDQMRRLGRLHAGFVGLRIQQVMPDMQALLGLPSHSGGIVLSILPGGPAEKAGIKPGDVVLGLNGRTPRDVRELLRDLGASAPGSTISLRVWSGGRISDVDMVVGEWNNSAFDPAGPQPEADRGGRQVAPDLGLHLSAIDPAQRRALQLADDQPAVAILAVAANSPAADVGLAAGDVILRLMDAPVRSAAEVTEAVARARAAGREAIMLEVQTGDRPRWVVVPVKGVQ